MNLNGYDVMKELTCGSGGRVFRVRRQSDGVTVIVKVVNNDAVGAHEKAMHEAIQRANPGGPSAVVRLVRHEAARHDLVLELENFDESLASLEDHHIQPIVLLNAAHDTIHGMVEMHNAGIINDDIKLANIVFKASSANRIAHCDLGGCRFRNENQCYGYTPKFNAPELEAGQVSETSCVYSWAIAMEHLCLRRIGASLEGVNLFELVPWVGSEFGNILIECVRRDPAERPSVRQLASLVKSWLARRKRCACSWRGHVLPGGTCYACCS